MEAKEDHPFVQVELMMPILPLVRVPDVDQAIEMAVRVEARQPPHRYDALPQCGEADQDSQAHPDHDFCENGPSYAGIGVGGEGYTTFTIAGPPEKGLTSAKSFARRRRCVLVGGMDVR